MQKKFVAVLASAMMLAVPTLGLAALAGSNTVNSAAIIDGEVKTADIANLAVTSAKIANGAVTATQISNGTITATQLASGAVTSTKLSAGAVTNVSLIDGSVSTTKIADGAITDAKISGPITVSKLAGVITVDKLANYTGVIIVHKGPIDSVNTFGSVTNAISSIGATTGRYAIFIAPGTYQENFSDTGPLTNNSYNVDLIGISRTGTVIDVAANGNYFNLKSGMIVKNMSITGQLNVNSGAAVFNSNVTNNSATGSGIYLDSNLSNVTLIDVIITSFTGLASGYMTANPETISIRNIIINSNSGYGIISGVGSNLKISDILISGSNFGIVAGQGSQFEIENAVISESLEVSGNSKISCNNCKISSRLDGDNRAIYSAEDIADAVKITNSKLLGDVVGGGINLANSMISGIFYTPGATYKAKATNCYNATFDPIPNGLY